MKRQIAELEEKITELEEENAALLTENLRWRDGMRLFSNPCVGDYCGDVFNSCDQLGSKGEEPF